MIEVFLFIVAFGSLIGMYSFWFYLIQTDKIKLPRHLDIHNKPGFKKETEDEQ